MGEREQWEEESSGRKVSIKNGVEARSNVHGSIFKSRKLDF